MARSPPRPWTVPDGKTSIVVKLTKRVIDEAVPAVVKGKARARLLLDADLTGFGIRIGIGKRSVKTFFAQRRVRGALKRPKIDKYGTVTPDEARETARGLLVQMGKGVDVADEKRKARARGITLQEALTAHIEIMHKKKNSPRTIAGYESILQKYSGDWMNRELARIDDAEVEQRHTRIAADVKAGKHAARLKHRQKDGRRRGAVIKREGKDGQVTANLWQRVFSVIYNSARKRNKRLPENPAATTTRFTIERERKTISDENLPKWWQSVNAIPNEVRADANKLMLFAGLRPESVRELKETDVDLDGAILTIRKPKGGISRKFDTPLPGVLVDLLRKRIDRNAALIKKGIVAVGSPWLFPATTMNPSKSGHIDELRHQSGSLSWTPRDARRAFSRVTDGLDVSRYAIKSLLNHSQPKDDVTGLYVKIETERLRPVMERISERLLSLVEPPEPATVSQISKARAKRAKAP